MSKIKHWDEALQEWVIDGASNAANIELSNPGYLNENGESISVDQGFTKLDNRIFKVEKNIAWIYQNGAKGGGGSGGGGSIDGTAYTINIDEGTRIYTSGNSVTLHITISGGSVRKTFNVVVQDERGTTKGTYVITGLTKTEITINGLTDSTNRLTINANTGQNYATPLSIVVIAGAIKLILSSIPNATIYPLSPINLTAFLVLNSTDSDLIIKVLKNGEEFDSFTLPQQKESTFRIDKISEFLTEAKTSSVGETFKFEVFAQGVLNDNILESNVISFLCTIAQPNTLYIITYDVNKSIPSSNIDLADLNSFVYGNSISFDYLLTFSDVRFSYYNITYSITPCYIEDAQILEETNKTLYGSIPGRVLKDLRLSFLYNTASLPDDTIYNINTNQYKFIKLSLTAVSSGDSSIMDTKVLYFTLLEATTKYITATNFGNNLLAYFSPVMGVPSSGTLWTYDNRNTRFPYSLLGIVPYRYMYLIGNSMNSFMSLTDTQGVHLPGKAWVDLGINLFSGNANEVNLFSGSGWSLSFTFRTDANVDDSDVVVSLGKYNNSQELTAGIEIQAHKVIYAVQTQLYSVNITKGDLITVDIVAQKYVGPGDVETNPTHWFIKTFLNGVLSLITSHTQSEIYNTENSGTYGWYFDDYLHIGGRVINEEIYDPAASHLYDFKVYTKALSDNEIVQNHISALIYAELLPGYSPDMSKQNELLQKNFILIGTDGNYHSILFDNNDETVYKDASSLLNSLVNALAESRIPYPIVVLNLKDPDPNFLGITESKFNEELKETVMSSKFAVYMDYYTMGNAIPTRIDNTSGDGMTAGIQGTSSLGFNSKNYEIYMGKDDNNKDVLILMREDWLPENRYTLKADVMDSSHVNNVLIGRIINGLVTTLDASGNVVPITPLDDTPPMSKAGYTYANKVKHTSEGYPCILFIKFKLNDPLSGSEVIVTRCMGIYNFNLGRYAYYNLGLKLLTSITYTDTLEIYPRMIATYTDNDQIESGSPVYSMEVQENNEIAMFDLADPDILNDGVFEFPYDSDGQGKTNLGKLLTFLADFGYNILTDRKVYILNDWKTPKLKKIGGIWQATDSYYSSYDLRNYTKSTLDSYMNWNNMVSYYIIAIIFGLVDSMAKNLTLRSWTRSGGNNVWYMCFYDMDTALRVNNVGAEAVPYNAHLHRYYTSEEAGVSEARVTNHCPSMSGIFNQAYSGYNTRLQEIVENLDVSYDSANSKTLQSVYRELRTNLFPDPEAFIDTYYKGQIDLIGSALYNYDYYLKYLQVEKTYNPATRLYGDNTYNYSEISYLHGNGSTNVKEWFVKRIKFLDGIYGIGNDSYSTLTGIDNTPMAESWIDNNATKITNLSTDSVTLGLQAESQIRIAIATANLPQSFWINETLRNYKVRNVTSRQRVAIYANKYLTLLEGFNNFTWDTIGSLNFPLIKSLSLRDQKNINVGNFLGNIGYNNLLSLVSLDLRGVNLINPDSTIAYTLLNITQQLPNLEELDISNSSFNAVQLSSSSVLRKLNLTNTQIKSINFSNLPMLEELIIEGCNSLEDIELRDCPRLKSIVIPNSVKTVFIGNCESIETILAPYYGNQRITSNLESITITSCTGLKTFSVYGLNNPNLEISLVDTPNLENINFSNLVTTNIILPPKSSWTTLKTLDISNSYIGYLNYVNTTPLITDYLDLDLFTNIESITARDNMVLKGIKCSQEASVNLYNTALTNCSSLAFMYGHYILNGTRIFGGCSNLKLNKSNVYNTYDLLLHPVPFIDNEFVCNISLSPTLNSMDEMFAGCNSLGSGDFSMMMLLMNDNITNLNKMFSGCGGIDTEIKYDLFRYCTNVTNITSFAENTAIRGGIYSRSEQYEGTFDFLPRLLLASYAFAGTSILFIDTNVFAPKDNKYIDIIEADYMFAQCFNLRVYEKATKEELIPNGTLSSKTFFTNLRNIGGFPSGMFANCYRIDMTIDSEEVDGVVFDYLFHLPTSINIRIIDSSIYTGINLIGEIHSNVFGGITKTDGEYHIVNFTNINAPFSESGNQIRCNLSLMGDMFLNIASNIILLKYVLKGLTFTNSTIPINIFEGCNNLTNILGFFSNTNITNNGEVFEFPLELMFRDCTKLQDVSYLFENDYNLNIRLIGEGFKNCLLVNVSNMLRNSGVFGMIPYRLFYMYNNGNIRQTIDTIDNVFFGCYKLGYTLNRTLDIGNTYEANTVTGSFTTTWADKIIKIPGSRISFELTFTDFDGTDEWFIDGRDWASINPELANAPAYNDTIFEYDRMLVQALSDTRDREDGYLNYMFPADYLRYCSGSCTMNGAFAGLSYYPNELKTDLNGFYYLSVAEKKDGLVGRLPCKLFSANLNNTQFIEVFKDLNFCAFINFDSYRFNALGVPASLCRGIKFPPDLLRNNVNLTSISGLFYGLYIEAGVDINADLVRYNINLTDISSMFRNALFNKWEYADSPGEYPLISYDMFSTNSELSNVSYLFAVDTFDATNRGLLLIETSLFGSTEGQVHNPRITNISGMFNNNFSMRGSIPLFDTSYYTRIRNYSNYIEGVTRGNITNANTFVSMHDSTWLPQAWIE